LALLTVLWFAPAAGAQVSDRPEVRAVMAAYHDVLAADPRLARARILVAEGSPESVTALRAYTHDHPKSGEAWYLLGVAYTRLGQEQAAAPAFARAEQLKPALRILTEEAKRRKAAAARAGRSTRPAAEGRPRRVTQEGRSATSRPAASAGGN
jgi:predicted Zn-dependent protease